MTKDDGLDIPASLKREMEAKPADTKTANQQAKPVDTKTAKGPTPKASPDSVPTAKAKSAAKAKPKKKVEPKKTDKREGLVTVVAIAKEYKLAPPEARALLRAAKLKKPAVGWAFAPNSPELKRVREVLKAGKASK